MNPEVEIGRCNVEELPSGSLRRLTHPPFDILLANVDGEVFALEDACPHSGQSLAEGHLCGKAVVCPAHEWKVALATGEVLTPIGQGKANPTYVVRQEGDDWVVYASRSDVR